MSDEQSYQTNYPWWVKDYVTRGGEGVTAPIWRLDRFARYWLKSARSIYYWRREAMAGTEIPMTEFWRVEPCEHGEDRPHVQDGWDSRTANGSPPPGKPPNHACPGGSRVRYKQIEPDYDEAEAMIRRHRPEWSVYVSDPLLFENAVDAALGSALLVVEDET